MATYGELRRLLDEQALGWQTRQDADQDTVPEWGLGASPEGLPHADETAALDLRGLLDAGPNPYLAVRRFERGALVHDAATTAVMMATPADLEDLALGFSLTEGIIASPTEARGIEVVETPLGARGCDHCAFRGRLHCGV